MPHEVYLFLHVAGIVLLSLSIGGILIGKTAGHEKPPKNMTIMNGVGLLFVLVSGFGMLARLGVSFPFPGWVWVKLTIWLLIGLFPMWGRNLSVNTRWVLAIGFIIGAAFLGIYKPF